MAVNKLLSILYFKIFLLNSFLGYFWEICSQFNSIIERKYLKILLLGKTINFQASN